jgi:fructokinase
MRQAQLFPLVRAEVSRLAGGYVDLPNIVPPLLGDRAGVCGALVLAEGAVQEHGAVHTPCANSRV